MSRVSKAFRDKCFRHSSAYFGSMWFNAHSDHISLYINIDYDKGDNGYLRSLFDVHPTSYIIRGTKAPYEPDWHWYLLT